MRTIRYEFTYSYLTKIWRNVFGIKALVKFRLGVMVWLNDIWWKKNCQDVATNVL